MEDMDTGAREFRDAVLAADCLVREITATVHRLRMATDQPRVS
jgi:hypothetical protein